MDDDGNWITEEASIGWLRQTYGLSEGAAKAALRTAVDSGNFKPDDRLHRMIDGEPKHIPPTISDLVADRFVHDLRLPFDDLRWQIEQQLGKLPAQAPCLAAPVNDPPAQKRADQKTINRAMLEHAKQKSPSIIGKRRLIDVCREATDCYWKQAEAAYRDLPPAFKNPSHRPKKL